MKTVIGVLLVLLLGLQYKLWFAKGNVSDILDIREDYKVQKERFKRLLSSNQKLSDEIKAFKQGGEVLEEKAREELGLVKEGEVFYQIVRKPSD